jgi:hypothetical protein
LAEQRLEAAATSVLHPAQAGAGRFLTRMILCATKLPAVPIAVMAMSPIRSAAPIARSGPPAGPVPAAAPRATPPYRPAHIGYVRGEAVANCGLHADGRGDCHRLGLTWQEGPNR